jgi:hypothetical protein
MTPWNGSLNPRQPRPAEPQLRILGLTANSELWDYSWSPIGVTGVPVEIPTGNNIPWNYDGSGLTQITVDTSFLASDQYELTMMTASQAGGDNEIPNIQLTGLEAVPEPSTIAMIGVGILSLVGMGKLKRDF